MSGRAAGGLCAACWGVSSPLVQRISTVAHSLSVRVDPQEYSDLRGILAPIDDTERQCHVSALPPNLESADHQFMAG